MNHASENIRAVPMHDVEVFGQAMRSPAFAEAGRPFIEKRETNYHGV